MLSPFLIIFFFVLASVIVNGFVYYYGWSKTGSQKDIWNVYQNKLIPPGFTIGFLWLAIFGFLGYSFYLLVHNNDDKMSLGSVFVLAFAVFALAYPLLTWKANEKNAAVINYLSVIFIYIVSIIVINENVTAFYYLLAPIIWCSYIGLTDSIMYRNMSVRDSLKKMNVEAKTA